jgi:hypothetical protein
MNVVQHQDENHNDDKRSKRILKNASHDESFTCMEVGEKLL